jgi:hypothetical protein
LNEPVKGTEYKRELNLESPDIEAVIAKDREPERSDKNYRQKVINYKNSIFLFLLFKIKV